ncbi:MAG: Uncharacterized MFS-type transporter, partial [uncultured Solirubrobacteraceae bacterium]
ARPRIHIERRGRRLPAAVGGSGGVVPVAAGHRARQHDPQRRAAQPPARSRRLDVGTPVDRRLLHAGVRRAAADRRRARRRVRPQAGADRRTGDIRHRVGARRPRADGGRADRRAGAHGRRRGAHHAVDPLHPHRHLPGRRAGEGDRDLGRRGRDRHRHRPGDRRLAARALRVGRDLRDQPAGGRLRGDRRSRHRAGVPRPAAAPARPRRLRPVDGRPHHAGVGDHRGSGAWLDRSGRRRGVRRRRRAPRRLRRVGAALSRAHASRAPVPRPALLGGQRDDRPRFLRDVRHRLLPHPVPAGGARLRRAGSGREDGSAGCRPDDRRTVLGEGGRPVRPARRDRARHARPRGGPRAPRSGRRRLQHHAGARRRAGARIRNRPGGRAGDRLDHGFAATGPGQRRLGGQRHHQGDRRSTGRRGAGLRPLERLPGGHGDGHGRPACDGGRGGRGLAHGRSDGRRAGGRTGRGAARRSRSDGVRERNARFRADRRGIRPGRIADRRRLPAGTPRRTWSGDDGDTRPVARPLL